MTNYSRRTLGLIRDLLYERTQHLGRITSMIVEYWKPKLFDNGIQTDVLDAMSSHSFYWTGIIPALAERKLGNNSYFAPPLSSLDQGEALDKLVKFLLDSIPQDASKGRELRESLAADGFKLQTVSVADSKIPEELSKLPKAEVLRPALGEHLRSGLVALLFIDLDNFKSVNDTSGHLEGDQCLLRAVRVISAAVLFKGKLYRWGGDEFAVVLPNFNSSEAAATAERIRAALDNESLGATIKVTASIGVATSKSNGVSDAATLEKLADDTMYIAKKKKNAVEVAP